MTAQKISTSQFDFMEVSTRRQALSVMRQKLSAAGIGTAGLDARLLLAHALGIPVADILSHDDKKISPAETTGIADFMKRRLNGESVARIVGTREFWGLPFRLSSETLEPRPDTETLVEAVLDSYPDRQEPLRILDLGTGTGCILIALLTEFPKASGIGADVSEKALTTATENALLNSVADRASFLNSDWFSAIDGKFDIVVSNPPYIRSQEIDGLSAEVRDFDPRSALDGGTDGLEAYRRILSLAAPYLTENGRIFLEIGFDQRQDVENLGSGSGFSRIICRSDLAGHPRVVILPGNGPQPENGS